MSRGIAWGLVLDTWGFWGNGTGSWFNLVLFNMPTWPTDVECLMHNMSSNCCGLCMPARGRRAMRVATWGEWNGFICIVRPNDFRCVLQCAIRSNSITEVRGDRRHANFVKESWWYQWGMCFWEGKNAPPLCVSLTLSPAVPLSKIWKSQSTLFFKLEWDQPQGVNLNEKVPFLQVACTFLSQLKNNLLEGLRIRTSRSTNPEWPLHQLS